MSVRISLICPPHIVGVGLAQARQCARAYTGKTDWNSLRDPVRRQAPMRLRGLRCATGKTRGPCPPRLCRSQIPMMTPDLTDLGGGKWFKASNPGNG